jgi:hypothetical protein
MVMVKVMVKVKVMDGCRSPRGEKEKEAGLGL